MKNPALADIICGQILDAIKDRQDGRFGYVRVTPEILASAYRSASNNIKLAEDLREKIKEAGYRVDVRIEYDIDLDTDVRMWLVSWGPGTGKVEHH